MISVMYEEKLQIREICFWSIIDDVMQESFTNLFKSVWKLEVFLKMCIKRCQHSTQMFESVWKLKVFQKMCIKSVNILPWICLKVLGDWRSFKRCVSKVPTCYTNLFKSVWKLKVFQKMCIKGVNILPQICFKMFGNWK